jgi:hypothetical protein
MMAKVKKLKFLPSLTTIKIYAMNNLMKFLFAFTLSWLIPIDSNAQFDDVYYDSSQDNWNSNSSYSDYDSPNEESSYSESYYDEDGDTYVTNNYYNDNYDEDYEYSKKLRRYYQPSVGLSYYNYYYTDYYTYNNFYNPYLMYGNNWGWNNWGWNRPVVSINVYQGNFGWNPYAYNNWGFNNYYGYNNWGWNQWGGYNYNPWGAGVMVTMVTAIEVKTRITVQELHLLAQVEVQLLNNLN